MMNRLIHTGLAVAVTLGMMGASGAQGPDTPQAGQPVTKLDSTDRQFLNGAAHSSALEITASRLALRKARHPEVKAFAQKMIDDHTKVGQQLSELAKSKGYEVPHDPSLMQKAKLKMLDVRDDSFDEAYAKEIGISAHEDTVDLFEKASQEAQDPDVKQFAIETLPNLQRHLESARNMLRTIAPANQ